MIPRSGKIVRPFYGRLLRQLEGNIVKLRSGRSVIPRPGNLRIDDADDPNGLKVRHMNAIMHQLRVLDSTLLSPCRRQRWPENR
jgi:hypothetical protein